MSFPYSDFIPVRSTKRRRNRPSDRHPPTIFELFERSKTELLTADSEWLHQSKLLISSHILSHILRPAEILCLGIGSPSASRDARAQLVFLLQLRESLSIPNDKVTVYDPVFSAQDTELLSAQLGLNTNRLIGHALHVPTIVFMPHCDMNLYESLLRENWSRDRLPNIHTLIANDLAEYIERNPARKLSQEFPCILKLVPYLESHPMMTPSTHVTAFNNITFQNVKFADLDEQFWLDNR